MTQRPGPSPTPAEEAAARKLCGLRGLDPDESVAHGPLDGSGLAICLYSPRYRLAAHEIRAHLQIHAAIAFEGEDTEEAVPPAGMDEYGGLE